MEENTELNAYRSMYDPQPNPNTIKSTVISDGDLPNARRMLSCRMHPDNNNAIVELQLFKEDSNEKDTLYLHASVPLFIFNRDRPEHVKVFFLDCNWFPDPTSPNKKVLKCIIRYRIGNEMIGYMSYEVKKELEQEKVFYQYLRYRDFFEKTLPKNSLYYIRFRTKEGIAKRKKLAEDMKGKLAPPKIPKQKQGVIRKVLDKAVDKTKQLFRGTPSAEKQSSFKTSAETTKTSKAKVKGKGKHNLIPPNDI